MHSVAGQSHNGAKSRRFGIRPLQKALQGTSIPKRFGTRQSDLLGRLPLAADRGYYGPVLLELGESLVHLLVVESGHCS